MTQTTRTFDRPGRGSHRTDNRLVPLVAALVMAAITTGATANGQFQDRDDDGRDGFHQDHRAYAIGLWGDLPYSPSKRPSAYRT